MTRIIAGTAGGRRLQVPAVGTRPTTDRVRESMFSKIDAHFAAIDLSWSDVRVLDLCAGSGALGLEAWSRGAHFVQCVERDRRAFRTLQANVDELNAASVATTCADVHGFQPIGSFDLCVFDPPYEWSNEDVSSVLLRLCRARALAPGCLVVVERGRQGGSPFTEPITRDDERRFGDTSLWYGQVVDPKGR
jgi:16S rRNA (guanine966-N2)-methyltransferase